MSMRSILSGSALAFLAAISSASAQDNDTYAEGAYPNEESIIVEAPYARRETVGREPKSGIPRQLVSYNIRVSIADLDLASPSDRMRLEDRVMTAAWEACRQLDRRYPPSIYIPQTSQTRRQCAERAADDGMAQAQMIADARSARADEDR